MLITKQVVLAAIVAFASSGDVRACAIAVESGAEASIASENSVIAWDEAREIEHFIRKVDFKASGSALGFLVPTPTRPEIAEADERLFKKLVALVNPIKKVTKGRSLTDKAFGQNEDEEVRVLEQKRVAGMDVAVLEASNAAALNTWLKKNGFPSRPALQKWFEPYVRAGFTISAFKYSKAQTDTSEIATKAVRISFSAPHPFYPYRMPTDTEVNSSQTLRVYLLTSKKVRGYLTEGTSKHDWGHITHILPIRYLPSLLADVLPADKLPKEQAWLTVFDDRNLKRTGMAELYFEAAQ